MAESKKAAVVPLEPKKSATTQNAAGSQQAGGEELYQGVVSGLPDKPKGLKAKESQFWDEFGQKLVDMGVLSEVDLSVFHRYVVTYVEWQHWNTKCQKGGGEASIQTFATGARQMSVEAILRKQAAELLLKLEGQLGLTPRARQAIKIENPNQGMLDL